MTESRAKAGSSCTQRPLWGVWKARGSCLCLMTQQEGFSINSVAPTLPTTHRLKQTPNFSFVPYSGYPQITAVHAACQFTLKSGWWPQLKLPKYQAEVWDCHVCLVGKKSWGTKYLLLSLVCICVGFTYCCVRTGIRTRPEKIVFRNTAQSYCKSSHRNI